MCVCWHDLGVFVIFFSLKWARCWPADSFPLRFFICIFVVEPFLFFLLSTHQLMDRARSWGKTSGPVGCRLGDGVDGRNGLSCWNNDWQSRIIARSSTINNTKRSLTNKLFWIDSGFLTIPLPTRYRINIQPTDKTTAKTSTRAALTDKDPFKNKKRRPKMQATRLEKKEELKENGENLAAGSSCQWGQTFPI